MMKSFLFVLFTLICFTFADNYDIIVAGGGTAGSVVASRLSENPAVKVLVLEQGDDNSDIFTEMVGFWGTTVYSYGQSLPYLNRIITENSYVRRFPSQESSTFGYRSLPHFSPVLMGGGSSINGNAFGRFSMEDLLDWNNTLWTYNSTLNCWKELETCVGLPPACNPEYHGTNGPIKTNTFTPNDVLQKITNLMPLIFGVPFNQDLNGPTSTGVGSLVRNLEIINGQPVRQDSYTKFLKPVLNRKNLVVKTAARVIRVIIKSNGKNELEYEHNGKIYRDKARKEVVFSMGVMNSAKHLLLSGIGNCSYLESLGIECHINNPEVGKNLQDSILSSMIFGTFEPSNFSGDPGAISAVFYPSPGFTDGTNMEVAVAAITGPPVFPTNPQLYLFQLTHLRHNGIGEVKLISKNPNLPPSFTFNFYQTDEEILPLVDQLKKVRDLMSAANISAIELRPGYSAVPFDATDSQIANYFKSTVSPEWHTVGSCSLNKVVDGRLRLINNVGQVVPGLRVIDLSIVPVKGRTHGTSSGAMFVAIVGSDFIKEDHNI